MRRRRRKRRRRRRRRRRRTRRTRRSERRDHCHLENGTDYYKPIRRRVIHRVRGRHKHTKGMEIGNVEKPDESLRMRLPETDGGGGGAEKELEDEEMTKKKK